MEVRYLDLPEVIGRTKLCRALVYAGMAAGTFPRALKRGRRSLWLESEIAAWIVAEAGTLPRMAPATGARPRVKRAA